MQDVTSPLRLAVGSHHAGSGMGCAMNVISWENGDKTITDFPPCSDRVLARIVQYVNDTICTHRGGDDEELLCPQCSVKVLALAHRTVGTAIPFKSVEEAARLYLTLAMPTLNAEVARTSLTGYSPVWETGLTLVKQFCSGTPRVMLLPRVRLWSDAVQGNVVPPFYGPLLVMMLRSLLVEDSWGVADHMSTGLVNCGGWDLASTGHLIDEFEKLSGIKATPVAEETTTEAVKKMAEVS